MVELESAVGFFVGSFVSSRVQYLQPSRGSGGFGPLKLKKSSSETHNGAISTRLCLAQTMMAQRRADLSARSSVVAASSVGGATLVLKGIGARSARRCCCAAI